MLFEKFCFSFAPLPWLSLLYPYTKNGWFSIYFTEYKNVLSTKKEKKKTRANKTRFPILIISNIFLFMYIEFGYVRFFSKWVEIRKVEHNPSLKLMPYLVIKKKTPSPSSPTSHTQPLVQIFLIYIYIYIGKLLLSFRSASTLS